MNWKMWAPLVLALVLGLAAAKFAMDFLKKNQKQSAVVTKGVAVVVAKKAIKPGDELDADALTISNVVADAMPAGAFTNVNDLKGRVALASILPGQAVIDTLLADSGTGRG